MPLEWSVNTPAYLRSALENRAEVGPMPNGRMGMFWIQKIEII